MLVVDGMRARNIIPPARGGTSHAYYYVSRIGVSNYLRFNFEITLRCRLMPGVCIPAFTKTRIRKTLKMTGESNIDRHEGTID